MKKIFTLILTASIMIVSFGQKVEAKEVEPNNSQLILTQDELCDVFPEYSDRIIVANNLSQQKSRTISDRAVKETMYQETETGDIYTIAFYDDGTYTATKSVTYSLTGSETSTSTKYTRKNASLIISDIKIGSNRMFTFDKISFTINKNSKDSLDDFYEVATAVVEQDGKVVNYSASINSFYSNETNSRLAGAHFYIANTYFAFQVGNNGWSIILDDGTIASVSVF